MLGQQCLVDSCFWFPSLGESTAWVCVLMRRNLGYLAKATVVAGAGARGSGRIALTLPVQFSSSVDLFAGAMDAAGSVIGAK
eukprot:4509220-Alexandrium_andersonii.AAC.1